MERDLGICSGKLLRHPSETHAAQVNTTMLILVCVHILTCMWFWVGRLTEIPVYEVSETLNEYGNLDAAWCGLKHAKGQPATCYHEDPRSTQKH